MIAAGAEDFTKDFVGEREETHLTAFRAAAAAEAPCQHRGARGRLVQVDDTQDQVARAGHFAGIAALEAALAVGDEHDFFQPGLVVHALRPQFRVVGDLQDAFDLALEMLTRRRQIVAPVAAHRVDDVDVILIFQRFDGFE